MSRRRFRIVLFAAAGAAAVVGAIFTTRPPRQPHERRVHSVTEDGLLEFRYVPQAHRERYAKASELLAGGQLTEAETEFAELTRLEPQSPGAWYGLGLAQLKQGAAAPAAESFEAALARQADLVPALSGLGHAARAMQKPDVARSHYQKAVDLSAGTPQAALDAVIGLGNVAADGGDYAAARRWFEKALALQPQAAVARDLRQAIADIDELSREQ